MTAHAITHGPAPVPLPGDHLWYARRLRALLGWQLSELDRERTQPASYNRLNFTKGQGRWARDQLEAKLTERQVKTFHFDLGSSTITDASTEAKTIHGFPSVVLPSHKYPRARQHPSTRRNASIEENFRDRSNASLGSQFASLMALEQIYVPHDTGGVKTVVSGSGKILIRLEATSQPAAELTFTQSLNNKLSLVKRRPPARTHRNVEQAQLHHQQGSPRACQHFQAPQSERFFSTAFRHICPQVDAFASIATQIALLRTDPFRIGFTPQALRQRKRHRQAAGPDVVLDARSTVIALSHEPGEIASARSLAHLLCGEIASGASRQP